MGAFLDSVPLSAIPRIADLMVSVKDPFRLDQGDVSFDAPDTFKQGMIRAIAENKTHYLQTAGVPKLLELLAEKLRGRNGIPVGSRDEVMVTNGGMHGLYIAFQALLETGDEVLAPDPQWPSTTAIIVAAGGVPVRSPLYESRGWRFDLDELASKVGPRTRAIYLNSPNNPTGGLLAREDLEQIAAIAMERNLWVISDEAYEDVIFGGGEHVSIASLPGMYERTIPVYTFSKTFAITGVRLGYVAVRDATLRARMKKVLLYTTNNVSSVVQFGGIAGLEGSQAFIDVFRTELRARRDLFYRGIRDLPGGIFTGQPPNGAFYAFLKINPDWMPGDWPAESAEIPESAHSLSWRMTEYLIKHGRVGSVPGLDFGPSGEGHVRFCFAREQWELEGALESMRALFGVTV